MKFISYDILFCVTPVSVQTCKLEWGSEKKSFQRGDNTLFLWGGENSDPFWLARAARSQFFKFNFLLDGIVRSLAGFFTNQAQFDSEYRHFFFGSTRHTIWSGEEDALDKYYPAFYN